MGHAQMNQCALVFAFLALEACWCWWAITGIALVPSNDICDLLLPETTVRSLALGELALPLVMGSSGRPVRRSASDFLFFAGHLEPGDEYYIHGDDERDRWIEGRENVTRQNASDFRHLFDQCILEPTSVVWEALAYPKRRIREAFRRWGVYDRVKTQVSSLYPLNHSIY